MNQNQTESFLISQANKLVDQATNDEATYSKLNITFDFVSDPKNWKYPITKHFQDSTGIPKAIEGLIERVIEHIAAFIFFAGGVEIQIKKLTLSPGTHIIVSTKGYYHYIGA